MFWFWWILLVMASLFLGWMARGMIEAGSGADDWNNGFLAGVAFAKKQVQKTLDGEKLEADND